MLKRSLYIIIFLVIAVFTGLFYIVHLMIYRPVLAKKATLTDKDYIQFFATTADKIKIRACFYKGKTSAGTILLCHGHGVTLEYMNDMVSFLRAKGYSLLLLDFRAHGKSGGKYTSIGLNEWKDIAAVIKEATKLGLITQKTEIAAYGRSMGAATLINGAEYLPRIHIFMLESSFERLRLVAARDGWRILKIPDTFITDIIFWIVSKITAIPYNQDNPVDNIAKIGKRPTLLIQDGLDPRATMESFNALKAKLPSAKTFIAKNAWHVKAHKTEPQAFEKCIIDFLDANHFPSGN